MPESLFKNATCTISRQSPKRTKPGTRLLATMLPQTLVALFAVVAADGAATRQPTVTQLYPSATVVTSGVVIMLTVDVSAVGVPCGSLEAACPLGQIDFFDDRKIVGRAQLNSSGAAHLNLYPGIGQHTVTASYIGTGSYAASVSQPQTIIVNGKFVTETALTEVRGTSADTLTATITSGGSVAPTGAIKFRDVSNKVIASGSVGSTTQKQTYSIHTLPPAGTYSTWSATTADVNDDGIPDLITSEQSNDGSAGSVSIRLGAGDGSFYPGTIIPLASAPVSLAAGDFNHDGWLDLVVATSDGKVVVLLGLGSGTFNAGVTFPVGLSPVSVILADLNNDGFLDIVTANIGGYGQHNGTISVLIGKGDGSFRSSNSIKVGPAPLSVAVADFDKDGNPDLLVGDSTVSQATILLGKGNGQFSVQPPTLLAQSAGPSGTELRVAIGDKFGNSSQGDLPNDYGLMAFALDSYGNVYYQDLGYYGSAPQDLAWRYGTQHVGPNPSDFTIGDFDGDGIVDLVAATPSGVDLLSNSIASGILGTRKHLTDTPMSCIAAGDFQRDGTLDLAGGERFHPGAYTLLNMVSNSVSVEIARSGVLSGVSAAYGGDDLHSASASLLVLLP